MSFLEDFTVPILNTVPSVRSILKSILFVFISLDDFFPYMFHERNYGRNFNLLFNAIHRIETEKWSNYDKFLVIPILGRVGIDKE